MSSGRAVASRIPPRRRIAARRGAASDATAAFEARCRALIATWGATWGRPGLEGTIRVELSGRLTRAIGRAMPRTRVVRLARAVADAPPESLAEVLCHEVAHVVAWDLHGPGVRPHGPQWAGLVRAAGFAPAIRIDPRTRGIAMPPRRRVRGRGPSSRAAARVYMHRCPVCGAWRLAGRVVRRWRCGRCVRMGLEGLLDVEARPKASSRLVGGLRALARAAATAIDRVSGRPRPGPRRAGTRPS